MILDLVRRRSDSPVGTMELVILRALEAFRDRGLKEASLNGIPLACVDRPASDDSVTDETADDSRLSEALRWLYDHGGAVYEAKNLFRFKSKFAPVGSRCTRVSRVGQPRAHRDDGRSRVPAERSRRDAARTRAPEPTGQRWCTGHEYVVRPPTDGAAQELGAVARADAAARDAWRSPVWEPPRRPSTRTVSRIAEQHRARSCRAPAPSAGSRPARHSTSSVSRFPKPAMRD